MSEAVPGTIVLTIFLLLTGFSFFFLISSWVEQDVLKNEAAAFQENRIETRLEISDVRMSPADCPAYTGPFNATIENSGTTDIAEFAQADVLVDYREAGDNKVVSRLQYGTEWTVLNLSPDVRNPNQWDPAETATIEFSLSPGLKPESNGVFLIASPQGISDSQYFNCPIECGLRNTGLTSPQSEAADSGGSGDGFENVPTNAFDDDGSPASTVNSLISGDNHQFYDFGVSINPFCEILGIEVRIDWWLLSNLGANSMDVELSWDGGTSWTTPKTDTLETTSEHTTVLGSDSDVWGHPWSPEEFDDADFRVRVTTNNGLTQDFFLDWVAVDVHYAPP
jgi:hypothetical protein